MTGSSQRRSNGNVQERGEASDDVWDGDCGSDWEAGEEDGSGRNEDGEMVVRGDKEGHDKEQIYQRDREDCKTGDKLRSGRLRWYGHVKRREEAYVGRRVLEMELPGRRKRGRQKRRWMDVVREDLREAGVEEGDT